MSERSVVRLILPAWIVFCAMSPPCLAEEGKLPPQGHLVAILDYDHVLENSVRYKTALDQLKLDTVKVENEHKTRNELLHKIEEELKSLPPGSPDFIKKQEEATLKKHELQARIQIERMKHEQQRVKIESVAMKEIDSITQKIAVEHNIAVVHNVSTREPQFRDLDAVEQHRQRRVVYFNPGLNITTLVLAKMNTAYQEESKLSEAERAAKAGGPKRPSVAPAEPMKN